MVRLKDALLEALSPLPPLFMRLLYVPPDESSNTLAAIRDAANVAQATLADLATRAEGEERQIADSVRIALRQMSSAITLGEYYEMGPLGRSVMELLEAATNLPD